MVIREFEEMKEEGFQLQDAFFETEILPIYWFDSNDRRHKIAGQQTIIDKKERRAISVVSTSYQFIHNFDAYKLADRVIQRVFNGLTLNDFECFNVYMPQSKGSCRIDLILRSANSIFPNLIDTWMPFIRISNSYNKTLVLKYEIGFCRGICLNGVIFDQRGITIRIPHSQKVNMYRIKRMIDNLKEVKGIQSLIDEFCEKINTLKSFEFPESIEFPETVVLPELIKFPVFFALAMYCKAFNIVVKHEEIYGTVEKEEADGIVQKRAITPKRIEQLTEEARLIINRAEQYFDEHGYNAYAIFNVLTDYATYPVAYSRHSIYIHGHQKKVGNWADDFIAEIQKPDFSLDKYFGEDIMKSAFVLESLTKNNY